MGNKFSSYKKQFSPVLIGIAGGLVGLAINLFPLPLFPGIHLLFGSIVSIFLAVRYGEGAGCISGLLAGSRTWWLWNQPFPSSALLLGGEGFWVGWCRRRFPHIRPLYLVLIYWVVFGSWVKALVLHYGFHIPWQFVAVIMLRTVVNSLFCALIAELLLFAWSHFFYKGKDDNGKLFRLSLSNIIALILMICISATLVFGFIYESRDESNKALEDFESSSTAAVATIRRGINGRMGGYYHAAAIIARLIEAEPIALTETSRLNTLLEATRKEFPDFAGLYIADANATTVAFCPAHNEQKQHLIGLNYSDRDYYREMLETKRVVYSGVYQARGAMMTPTAAIGVPFFKKDGSFAGYVLAWFEMSMFEELARQISSEQSDAQIMVVDKNGGIITDTRMPKGQYLKVKDVNNDQTYQLTRKSEEGGEFLIRNNNPEITVAVQDFLSEHERIAWTTVPLNGWKVIAFRPGKHVVDTLARFYLNSLALLFVLLIFAALIAQVAGRKLTRPITLLEAQASRLASGDFSAKIPPAYIGSFETYSLTNAFRKMAESLETYFNERIKTEAELRQSEKWYRLLFEENPQPILTLNVETQKFLSVNEAAVERYGYSHEEFLTFSLENLRAENATQSKALKSVSSELRGKVWHHKKKSGEEIWVELTSHQIKLEKCLVEIIMVNDVTEKHIAEEALRKSEEQLRQSQKLEAIGLLAGGVAHDFNNMLTIILSYCELTLMKLEPDSPLKRNIDAISKAGERSATLTRQLLAFSRKQMMLPVVMNLNSVVADIAKLLTRLLGENITLRTNTEKDVWLVKADRGQIEQVIMNLVVNARDAMPNGGELGIETKNYILETRQEKDGQLMPAGKYVALSISDTGTGISPEIRARIFEPFFTTKEFGTGTGLGLSTVYGIVKQSEGYITVESELDVGTTFTVYLPATDLTNTDTETKSDPELLRGSETILLVEDETVVRNLVKTILESSGYKVLDAPNGVTALEQYRDRLCEIDLIVTDVAMPKMNGRELIEKVREIHQETKVLYMSGHTDDMVFRNGLLTDEIPFIQKPFTAKAFTEKVKELLKDK